MREKALRSRFLALAAAAAGLDSLLPAVATVWKRVQAAGAGAEREVFRRFRPGRRPQAPTQAPVSEQ